MERDRQGRFFELDFIPLLFGMGSGTTLEASLHRVEYIFDGDVARFGEGREFHLARGRGFNTALLREVIAVI